MNDYNDPPTSEGSFSEQKPHDHFEWSGPRNIMNSIFWATMLIMAGGIYLANNLGMLPQVGTAQPWHWIMLGAGSLLVALSLAQAISPDLSGPSTFWVIVGVGLVGYALSEIFGLDVDDWWPVILIAVGAASLLKAVSRR